MADDQKPPEADDEWIPVDPPTDVQPAPPAPSAAPAAAAPAPPPRAAAAPAPPPPPPPPAPSSSGSPADAIAGLVPPDRPELLVGGAFVGGLLAAQILKRLGRR